MKQVEAELRLQSRKNLSSPPTTNTFKLQLHMEQLSLSIIWKLEYLCYEKGYKERTTWILIEEGVKKPTYDPYRGRERYHRLEAPPYRMRVLSPT